MEVEFVSFFDSLGSLPLPPLFVFEFFVKFVSTVQLGGENAEELEGVQEIPQAGCFVFHS